jgi:hypothetical protein
MQINGQLYLATSELLLSIDSVALVLTNQLWVIALFVLMLVVHLQHRL